MNGANEPADQAQTKEKDGRDAHEPDDEVHHELARPLAEKNGKGWDEKGEEVTHINNPSMSNALERTAHAGDPIVTISSATIVCGRVACQELVSHMC
jgi:hypothetical protein